MRMDMSSTGKIYAAMTMPIERRALYIIVLMQVGFALLLLLFILKTSNGKQPHSMNNSLQVSIYCVHNVIV